MILFLLFVISIVIVCQLTVFSYQKAIEKEKGIERERKPFINYIFTNEYLQARHEKKMKKVTKC